MIPDDYTLCTLQILSSFPLSSHTVVKLLNLWLMLKKVVCNYQRYLFDNGVDININIRSVMRLALAVGSVG